jgi:pyruvate formate lyase activating enzyme
MKLHEASWWKPWKGQAVCQLCPWACVLLDGDTGKCGVRKNRDGTLISMNYGKIVAQNIDPIEKKPLFHFWPGSRVYSVAAPGCNLHCEFCQNWQISQVYEFPEWSVEPEDIVEGALKTKCQGIAYTYTEPTVFYEFCRDTAKLAREAGLFNVWVSNGMINPEPAREIAKLIDAINIDVKGDDQFYKRCAGGLGLQPVLNSVKEFHKQGVWVEVTNLLIPGVNDSEKDIQTIVDFIEWLDPAIPLHFSRFHPYYKMTETYATPAKTIEKAVALAKKKLAYVYAGNLPGHEAESTYCPGCGRQLIGRHGMQLGKVDLKGKKCPACGQEIRIVGKIIKPLED